MTDLQEAMTAFAKKVDDALKLDAAIEAIKTNPDNYPEFDFWVPGFEVREWCKKAISDFDEKFNLGGPIEFKLSVMRHYRKLAQKWRKEGKTPEGDDFFNEVVSLVKENHPEWFGKEK